MVFLQCSCSCHSSQIIVTDSGNMGEYAPLKSMYCDRLELILVLYSLSLSLSLYTFINSWLVNAFPFLSFLPAADCLTDAIMLEIHFPPTLM